MDGKLDSNWVSWPTFTDEPPPVDEFDDEAYGGFTSAPTTAVNHSSTNPLNSHSFPPLPVPSGEETGEQIDIEDLSKEIDALSKEFSSDGQVLSFPEVIDSPEPTNQTGFANFSSVTHPHGIPEASNGVEDEFGDFATPEVPTTPSIPSSINKPFQITASTSPVSDPVQVKDSAAVDVATLSQYSGLKGKQTSVSEELGDSQEQGPISTVSGESGWNAFNSSGPTANTSQPLPSENTTFPNQWEADFGEFTEFQTEEGTTDRIEQGQTVQSDDFGEFSSTTQIPDDPQMHTVSDDSFGDFTSKNNPPAQGDGKFTDFSSCVSIPKDDDFGDFSSSASKPTDDFGDFSSSTSKSKDAENFGDFSSSTSKPDDDDFGDFSSSTSKPSNEDFGSFGDFTSAATGGGVATPPTSRTTTKSSSTSALLSKPVKVVDLQEFKDLLGKCYPERKASTDTESGSCWSMGLYSLASSQNKLWFAAQTSRSVQGLVFQWENSETQDNFFVSAHVDPAMAPAMPTRQVKSALHLENFENILQDPASPLASPAGTQTPAANVLLDLSFQPSHVTAVSEEQEKVVLDEDLLGLDFSLSVQPPQPPSKASTEGEVSSGVEVHNDDFGDFSTAPVSSVPSQVLSKLKQNSSDNFGEFSVPIVPNSTSKVSETQANADDDFGDFSSAEQLTHDQTITSSSNVPLFGPPHTAGTTPTSLQPVSSQTFTSISSMEPSLLTAASRDSSKPVLLTAPISTNVVGVLQPNKQPVSSGSPGTGRVDETKPMLDSEDVFGDFSSAAVTTADSSIVANQSSSVQNLGTSNILQPTSSSSFGAFLSTGALDHPSAFVPVEGKTPVEGKSPIMSAQPFLQPTVSVSISSGLKGVHGSLQPASEQIGEPSSGADKEGDLFGDFSSAKDKPLMPSVATSTGSFVVGSGTSANFGIFQLSGQQQTQTGAPVSYGPQLSTSQQTSTHQQTSQLNSSSPLFPANFSTSLPQSTAQIPLGAPNTSSVDSTLPTLAPVLTPHTGSGGVSETGSSGWSEWTVTGSGGTVTGSGQVSQTGSNETTITTGNSGWTITSTTQVTLSGSSSFIAAGSSGVSSIGNSGTNVTVSGDSPAFVASLATSQGWTSSLISSSSSQFQTAFPDKDTHQKSNISSSTTGEDDFGDFSSAGPTQTLAPSTMATLHPVSSYSQQVPITSQISNPISNFTAFGMQSENKGTDVLMGTHQFSTVANVSTSPEGFSDFASFQSVPPPSDRITMSSPTRLSSEAQRVLDRIPDVRFMLSNMHLPAQSTL
jgi:hypothetical protein